MSARMLCCLVIAVACNASPGCREAAMLNPAATWHDKVGWEAEAFFDDPEVVALCKAIEANDLEEMKRLIEAGADVNAKGKGNMTPLLWAFFDDKLPRFKLLLENGADPNVLITDDFGPRSGLLAGEAVTHLASSTSFPGYFEAVFENGGDPNLVKQTKALGRGDTPIFDVLMGRATRKKEKIEDLISLGANLDHMRGGTTAAMLATGSAQYDLALFLLEQGADYTIYKPNSNTRLVHVVLLQEYLRGRNPHDYPSYQPLLDWLEDHGESIDEARADLKRWRSWSNSTGEYRRKMDAEVAARKRREAREEQAAQENGPVEDESADEEESVR